MKQNQIRSDIVDVVKGAGINIVGALIGNSLRIFYYLFLARLLTQAELGLYSLGLTVFKLLVVVSVAGLDSGVVRFVSLYKGEQDLGRMKGVIAVALRICIPLSFLVGIGLFFLSDMVSVSIFAKPELANVLKCFSFVIPFFSVTIIFLSATQSLKLMQYKVYSRELGENILKFIFTSLFFLLGWRLYGAVFANVVSFVLVTGVTYYFIKKVFSVYEENAARKCEFRKILGFSFPNMLSEIIVRLIMWTDILMIGYFLESKDVGIYSIVSGIVWLGVVFVESFATIFNPIIADLYNRKEFSQLDSLFKTVNKWVFTTSLPFYLLVIFFARELLNIYGDGFVVGCSSLVVFGFAQIFVSAIALPGYVLIMSGRSWLNMTFNIVICCINIALNYILIPRYGIVGAAFATGFSLSSVSFLRMTAVFYHIKMQPFNSSYLKPLLAGLISICLIFFISNFNSISNQYLNMSLCIIIFFLSYILLLFAQKIDSEDLFILNLIREKLSYAFVSSTR